MEDGREYQVVKRRRNPGRNARKGKTLCEPLDHHHQENVITRKDIEEFDCEEEMLRNLTWTRITGPPFQVDPEGGDMIDQYLHWCVKNKIA